MRTQKKYLFFHVEWVCQCTIWWQEGKGVPSWGVAKETQERTQRTLCTHWKAKGVPSWGMAGKTQEPSPKFLCTHWTAGGEASKEPGALCTHWKAKRKASQEQGGGERR